VSKKALCIIENYSDFTVVYCVADKFEDVFIYESVDIVNLGEVAEKFRSVLG